MIKSTDFIKTFKILYASQNISYNCIYINIHNLIHIKCKKVMYFLIIFEIFTFFTIYDKFPIFRNIYLILKDILIINIKIMKKFKYPNFHNLI